MQVVLQIQALRLLRVILPSWQVDGNTKDQKQLTVRLFKLLGRILVLPISPFLSEEIVQCIIKWFTSFL